MAVDLHTTTGDTTWLTSQFLPDNKEGDDILSHSLSQDNNINKRGSPLTLKPQAYSIDQVQMNNKDEEDFIDEITHQMDRFLLLDDHDQLHYSASKNMELLSWELMASPQSTLWSPTLGSNKQGSSEGSSSQEPSPPPTPPVNGGGDQSCWRKNTCSDMPMMFENINLNERSGNSINNHHHHGHKIQNNFNSSSNVGPPGSYQSLIQEQIRSIELTRLKQEHVVQRATQIIPQAKEHVEQTQKKGLKGCGNGRGTRPPRRPSPDLLLQLPNQQQGGSGMRALFLGGGSGSSSGTGVFLPRGGNNTTSESTKKQGKGCSTVLIPARVVQALQQHFDQMAANMSGPKPPGLPPLHDILVSNKDGMYSLQKHQSRKAPSNIKNETILPQEWTY